MNDDAYNGLVCCECHECFEVWTNIGGPGLCYCPCCGHEFTEEELDKMEEEAPNA